MPALLVIAVLAAITLRAAVKVVPEQEAWIVERLGRYHRTLIAGPHLIAPFLERIQYRHNLREQMMVIGEQDCLTKDKVPIKVDAVLHFQINDPVKASYGIADSGLSASNGQLGWYYYRGPILGLAPLAETAARSEIGKIELDRTFEEQPAINDRLAGEIDKASAALGVKVLRLEIRKVTLPEAVRSAMERQLCAEREKRTAIIGSEGRAATIRAVATATAAGIREVADAIQEPAGLDAARLRVAEQYVQELGKLADRKNTVIFPMDVSDAASIIALAVGVKSDRLGARLRPALQMTRSSSEIPKTRVRATRFVAAAIVLVALLSAGSLLMAYKPLGDLRTLVQRPFRLAALQLNKPRRIEGSAAGIFANRGKASVTATPGDHILNRAQATKDGGPLKPGDLAKEAKPQPYQELLEVAREGNPAAQAALGNIYLRGKGVAKDYGQAIYWFHEGASHGNRRAQAALGYMYATGEGVPQDYTQARQWSLKAAAQDDSNAQYNLAIMYDLGQGVPKDQAEALKWFRRSAAQNDARAQYQLGIRYMIGRGVSQDYSRALQWLQKAAEQGDAKARLNLGAMYEEGKGVSPDYAEAVRWYQMAAAQGEAYAQTSLGVLYCKGQGVVRDYAKAAEWFTRAASQGEPKAECNLGIMYDTGLGVAKDYAEAARWYRRAAAQGQVDAQYNLGYLYEHGQGLARDDAAALEWYRKAAGKGDSSALQRVKILESKTD